MIEVEIGLHAVFWLGVVGALACAGGLLWNSSTRRVRQRTSTEALKLPSVSQLRPRLMARSEAGRASAPPLRPRELQSAATLPRTKPPPRPSTKQSPARPRGTEARDARAVPATSLPVSRRVVAKVERIERQRTATLRPDADITSPYKPSVLEQLEIDVMRDGPLPMHEVVRRADAAQIEYLNLAGRRARALVTAVSIQQLCGRRRIELGVRVMPEGRPAYDAKAPVGRVDPHYRSGDSIGVRFDPKRPQFVAIDRTWLPTRAVRVCA